MKKIITVTLSMVLATCMYVGSCFGHGYLPIAQRFAAQAITEGNSSCIPLSTSRDSSLDADLDGARTLLYTKEAFGNMHPELKITGSHETYEKGKFIFLWIDHIPADKRKRGKKR